jgi:hypothetical protein
MKESEFTLLQFLKKYNLNTFPVFNYHLDSLDDEAQDNDWKENNIIRNASGESSHLKATDIH